MVIDLGRFCVLLALVGRGSLAEDPPLKYSDDFPLGICEGDCDDDEDCKLGLSCFKRQTGGIKVRGCSGNNEYGADYCYDPPPGVLVKTGDDGIPRSAFPLGECEGDCDGDEDCELGLCCFQRNDREEVDWCFGDGIQGVDYCYDPPPGVLVRKKIRTNNKDEPRSPVGECKGECRKDEHCKGRLRCFIREAYEEVPGCTGGGIKGLGYCYDKTKQTTENSRDSDDDKNKLKTGNCQTWSPCAQCEGNCRNSNDNCKPGLTCIMRSPTKKEPIPGCYSGGPEDLAGIDYCAKDTQEPPEPPEEYSPPQAKKPTYVPGEPSVVENGLLLSKGLTARIIAIKDQKVKYDVGNGKSSRDFHIDPDGGAVFADAKTGGWIYVSNSEEDPDGGVGAITFNSKGQVIDYSWLLGGTERNCGGGKTYWNTWLSCEEVPDGHVWEVDPWNKDPPRRTIIGGKDGDRFEAAAYDNRNKREPVFYVTIDRDDGPVLKFTPDKRAVEVALDSNPPNYKDILHTNPTGTAKMEYLVIQPKQSNPDEGTFYWTQDKEKAEKSASRYYQKCEGIDIRKGVMYVTCKFKNDLFVFDLDEETYERETTLTGAFGNLPDQIGRIVGEGDDILYFCEGGSKPLEAGVHGRDANGNFYTILENAGQDPDFYGETSGLAFSPDNIHMYFAYMKAGIIFDVTRRDGFPFGGQRLDIKLHGKGNVFEQN